MATVTIGCKLPNGFTMELNGVTKKIHGTQSELSKVIIAPREYVGLTEDVDKAFWDAWRTKFADHPLVCGSEPYNQPFVFEAKSESSVKAIAKETREVKTGLERKKPSELDKVAGALKLDTNAEE